MGSAQFNCPNCNATLVTFTKSGQRSSTTFESTRATLTPQPGELDHAGVTENKSFWASDGVTYSLAGLFAGGVAWLVMWLMGWSAVPAIIIGFVVGVGLHVLKITLHAPSKPAIPKPATPNKTTIALELWSKDKRHAILDQFDERITWQDLKLIPRAVYTDPSNHLQKLISQAALEAQGLSQYRARLLLTELKRLNLAHTTKQNRTIIIKSAIAKFEKLPALPS